MPCRISGSFLARGGLTAFRSPGWTLVRSGISCLVSLLTSLRLNSVQNTAIKSPVHTKHCYSEISVSSSGSHGLPWRCTCGSSGSVLPEPLTEGNHPKITASGLGSHRVHFLQSFKAPALFWFRVLTLFSSRAFLLRVCLGFCLFSEDLRLWGEAVQVPQSSCPPSGKVLGEVFTTFQVPSICLLRSCFRCISIAHFQRCITRGRAACSWSPPWAPALAACHLVPKSRVSGLCGGGHYRNSFSSLTHLPFSFSPRLQVQAVPGAMSAPCRPCHGRL